MIIDQSWSAVRIGDHNQVGDISVTVNAPFVPRSVAADPAEIAAAMQRLDSLPLTDIPAPSDALPHGSHMELRRNHQFVGREADLRTLARLLKGGENVAAHQAQSVVMSGLGGIGKTQLAIEFVYRYGTYFAGVFWLNAAQPDLVANEIAHWVGRASWNCSPKPPASSLMNR